ncbi:peroxisomal membrane protein 11C [Maylandia zebra]|uniref:peroxisomal membrane protein 11C n=1 Tax=Maylandia zebra TaxID=106582 RepID=UPI00403CBFDE
MFSVVRAAGRMDCHTRYVSVSARREKKGSGKVRAVIEQKRELEACKYNNNHCSQEESLTSPVLLAGRRRRSIESTIFYLSLLWVLPVSKSSWGNRSRAKTANLTGDGVGLIDFLINLAALRQSGADMQRSLESLVQLLESYRGRDKVIRTVCYGSQLVGGVLSRRAEADVRSQRLGKSLLLFSAQLSHCRTVLRLFDDFSMLAYSHSYGFGNGEEDAAVRWISVLNNVADQLYYPCEHIAWAADAELIRVKSDKWWLFSTVLWGTSLLLGILRSLRVLLLLRKKLKKRHEGRNSRSQLRRQMRGELLSILSSMADLSNAIHWMPPGFLWAGRFPNWLVGLMGTTSSLIGLIQMNAGSGDQSDTTQSSPE